MATNLRFALTMFVLIGTAVFLQARSVNEQFPAREPLASLPHQLHQWQGTDESISPETLKVLGKGDFLSRIYLDASSNRPVQLFIAYFPSQRTGEVIHSPQNCLPGSGWSPLDSAKTLLTLPGHAPFSVNRYLIGKGDKRELVFYWYLSHDRAEASEYWAKFYLVMDSVRLSRSDGALIRISAPLRRNEAINPVEERLVAFAGELTPIIHTYVPR